MEKLSPQPPEMTFFDKLMSCTTDEERFAVLVEEDEKRNAKIEENSKQPKNTFGAKQNSLALNNGKLSY